MVTGTFRGLSLNYKQSSVQIREQVALNEKECIAFLKASKEAFNLSELFVLSTCNRTELYYTSQLNLDTDLIKLLCAQKGINSNSVSQNFFSTGNQNETVSHLFRVALGLESQVIGDLQIINQVKKAYQWTADEELAGPFLHRLLHSIFYSNKKVVQETAFRDGAASVSYAAVELINQLASTLVDPKILILGLGEMGEDICSTLATSELQNITIANRTIEKATAIANGTGFSVSGIDDIKELVQHNDIIISSVSAKSPIITGDLVSQLGIHSYKYFIDIAVPRSIEDSCAKSSGVVLYNIDEIQNKASEALEKRIKAIPEVEIIAKEAIDEFNNWNREFEVSPTIQKLKNALEEIRKQEISRHLKNLDEDKLELVDLITKNITQKIIKLPVLQLKAACQRGDAENLIDVLNEIFDLEKQKV